MVMNIENGILLKAKIMPLRSKKLIIDNTDSELACLLH